MTFAALVLFLIVLAAALIGDVDFIEMPANVLVRINQGEVDEILIAFLIIGVAFMAESDGSHA